MRVVEHTFTQIPQDGRRSRAWIASLAPLEEARLEPGLVVPLGAFHRYHHLGEVVLAAHDAPAQATERTERLVAAQGLDHLVLRAHATGRARVEAGARIGVAAPGDVVVLDLAQPVRIDAQPTRWDALIVPRRLLLDPGDDGSDRHGRIIAAAACPIGRLVGAYIGHLSACLPTASAALSGDLVTATIGLCRVLLRSTDAADRTAGPGPDAIAGAAVRRFIEDNLARVDVPLLMARFGISRAPLYRMFVGYGGVYAYIRDRRLAAAMRRLGRTDGRRPMIARLAHETGFADARTFSRAFRRRYGLGPTEVSRHEWPYFETGPETPPMTWLRDL